MSSRSHAPRAPRGASLAGAALAVLLALAHPLGAAAPAPPPADRPLDLLVVAALPGGGAALGDAAADAAGNVTGLAVRCWERSTAQDAMHGDTLGRVLGIAAPAGRQIGAREVADLAAAGGAVPPRRACAALAPAVRRAGGKVSYQPAAGDRDRCVVAGLGRDALVKLFAACFDI